MYTSEINSIQLGKDPRQFADFISLTKELNKRTHPARPDIDWQKVEDLSIALFEQNGIDLQTLAWYCLAKTRLNNLSGLEESLLTLEKLLTHQWEGVWPKSSQVRIEILVRLHKDLQAQVRTFSLTEEDVNLLEQVLQILQQINAQLQYFIQAKIFTPLTDQIKHILSDLTKGKTQPKPRQIPEFKPFVQIKSREKKQDSNVTQDIKEEIKQAALEPSGETTNNTKIKETSKIESAETQRSINPRKYLFFGIILGIIIMLGLSWGWSKFISIKEEPKQVLSTQLSSIPKILNVNEIEQLKTQPWLGKESDLWLQKIEQQLSDVNQLPPDWQQDYTQSLLSQIQTFWPKNSEAIEIYSQWNTSQKMVQLNDEELNGWHDGMQQLQNLSDKLEALDGQKGKYITVSELKSITFSMMNDFKKTQPLQEKLRQLKQNPTDKNIQVVQIESDLESLIETYHAMKE